MSRVLRWGATVALTVTSGAGIGAVAGAQSLPDLDVSQPPKVLCQAVFAAGAFAGFAANGEVAAGEPVSVAVEWQPSNVDADKVDVLGCVNIDGTPADGLATLGRKIDNDGEHHLSFLLPDDISLGAKVCERSAVIGPGGDITRTPATCFSVASAPAAEAAKPAPAGAKPAPAEPKAATTEPKAATAEPKAAPAEPKAAAKEEAKPAIGPPAPVVAGVTEDRAAADAPDTLARTGSVSRLLGVLAGTLLGFGGLAVALGGPRLQASRARRRQ